jgi:hypothetical protein
MPSLLDEEAFASLWDSVKKSNPEHLKRVGYGARKFVAIDAYRQIESATKKFGPMGIGFGLRNIRPSIIEITDGEGNIKKMLMIEAVFFFRVGEVIGEIEIMNDVIMDTRGDWAKKIQTDTITKALSYLGFNADVFCGRFDDNKYTDRIDVPAPDFMKTNLESLLAGIPEERAEKIRKQQMNAGWTKQSVDKSITALVKAYKENGKELPEFLPDPDEEEVDAEK